MITNLRALRDFFRGGLKLEVYHKKILSWPLEREPTPEVSKSKSPKGSASKSKDVKKVIHLWFRYFRFFAYITIT